MPYQNQETFNLANEITVYNIEKKRYVFQYDPGLILKACILLTTDDDEKYNCDNLCCNI